MKARVLPYAVGGCVSALCVYLAVRRVEWQRFADSVTHVRLAWLLAGAAANACAGAVAGLRWRAIARPIVRLSKADAVEIVFVANLGNLMVARLGDLIRAVLTARRGQAPTGPILGVLVVERFADVLMLLVLAVGLSGFVSFPVVIRAGVITFAIVAAAALVALWLAADWLPAIVRRVVGWVLPSFASSLASVFESFSRGVRSSALSGQLPVAILLSAGAWVLSGASIILTIRAFSLPVPWFAGLFVMLVINLGGVLPASPGGIGVYHYLVVLALSLWTQDSSAALGYAIVNHALGLILAAFCGVIALWRQGMGLRDLSASWATSVA